MIQLLIIAGKLVFYLGKEIGKIVIEKGTEIVIDKAFEKNEKKDEKTTTKTKNASNTTSSNGTKSSSASRHTSSVQQMNVTHIIQEIDSGALAAQLSSALKGEFETLKNQISSMQLAKLNAAFSFLHRALIDFESFLNNPDQPLTEKELDRAMSWIRQANTNATEAFFDKANVSVEGRQEAMQLMMFCSGIEYFDDHKKIISSWARNVRDYLMDEEICNGYKAEIKLKASKTDYTEKYAPLPLQAVYGSLALSVDSFIECNPSLVKDRENFFALLDRPPFIFTDAEALIWTKAILYLMVPNHLQIPVCINYNTFSNCPLPNHLYARLVSHPDDRVSIQIMNVWTRQYVRGFYIVKENDYTSAFCRMIYIFSHDLIIIYEAKTRDVQYYKFDGANIRKATTKEAMDLPRKIPNEMLSIDDKSYGEIKVDATGQYLFATEISTAEKEVKSYIWNWETKNWKKTSNAAPNNVNRCIKATEDGAFVLVIHNQETKENFLARMDQEGTFTSVTPFGIRVNATYTCFSSDYKHIIALSKIYDHNQKFIRHEVDMYDAKAGYLLANEKLPSSCTNTLEICEMAGRIIVADYYSKVHSY